MQVSEGCRCITNGRGVGAVANCVGSDDDAVGGGGVARSHVRTVAYERVA